MLLKRDLLYALEELNEHLTPEECQEAVRVLEQVFVGDSLLQTNEAKCRPPWLGCAWTRAQRVPRPRTPRFVFSLL